MTGSVLGRRRWVPGPLKVTQNGATPIASTTWPIPCSTTSTDGHRLWGIENDRAHGRRRAGAGRDGQAWTTSATRTSRAPRVQLAEMDADQERTGLGRLMLFGDCVRAAANRLRIHDLLTRQPEILEIPIARPVIVVGLPRSGTTHLVNLLAADTRFRSMPLWECYEPVPPPTSRPRGDGVDPRWTRCQGPGRPCRRSTARGGHAPDGARPRPRGDRAADARLLELQARVGGPGAAAGATTTWPTTRHRTTPT